MRACVDALRDPAPGRTPLFVLQSLCDVLCPTKPEPSYLVVLNKSSTQEEFIRGGLMKNPYSTLEVGPAMRDVKNFICRQLDLFGLVEVRLGWA